jgi:hypothetical protein
MSFVTLSKDRKYTSSSVCKSFEQLTYHLYRNQSLCLQTIRFLLIAPCLSNLDTTESSHKSSLKTPPPHTFPLVSYNVEYTNPAAAVLLGAVIGTALNHWRFPSNHRISNEFRAQANRYPFPPFSVLNLSTHPIDRTRYTAYHPQDWEFSKIISASKEPCIPLGFL